MAFPWDFQENFETGTKGSFATEFDADLGRIDYPGPQDASDVPPYQGGYLMRVDMNRGATTIPDAYLEMDTALDLTTGQAKYVLIMFRIGDDTKIPGAGDSVTIFQLISGGGPEAAVGLVRSDKGDIMLAVHSPEYATAVAGGIPAGWIRGIDIRRNVWYALELTLSASSTAGAAELRVNCNDHQVSAVGMTWATLTSARMGAINQSKDIRGTLYFDSIVVDEDRLVAPQLLDPLALDDETITLTKTGYAFVGPGEVDCVTLIAMRTTASATTSNHAVHLYDTDRLPIAHHDLKIALKAAVPESYESKGKKMFKRGCYVVLSGDGVLVPDLVTPTAPTAIIKLGMVSEYSWGGMA